MSKDAHYAAGSELSALSALPVRVAGIVFWGLVAIGLFVVVLALGQEQKYIVQFQQSSVDRFISELNQQIVKQQSMNLDDVVLYIQERAAVVSKFHSITVQTGKETIEIGQPVDRMDCYTRPILLPGLANNPVANQIDLSLCLTSVESQISQSRKNLLLGMGGLFLVFGLILQKILNSILSRPFRSMISTAMDISNGNDEARFAESKNDEFGYLGRFINQALDYSKEQRNALHQALEQVCEAEFQLYEEKEKAVVTLHSIGDAVITTNAAGNIEYMNPAAEELTGWASGEAIGIPFDNLMRMVEEESKKAMPSSTGRCLQTGERKVCEQQKLLLRRDGNYIAIADSAAPIRDYKGVLIGAVTVFRDVGHARQLAQRLSYQASHDPLTGLYNRREFEARLEQLLDSAQNQSTQHALCYIDLDQFKVVNDVCGHSVGDELLRQLAEILQSQIRDADILARLGGDEFGVLLSHCSLEQATRIAENLRSALHAFRFSHEERSFEVGASIGVIEITEASRSAEEVMSAADIACYAAKDNGRNRIHVYKPSSADLEERRGEMNWVSEVRAALDEDRFKLLFQPIVPVTGAADQARYEFLLRMQKGDSCILPMAFIPAAERYKLMPEIDRWVVNKTIALLKEYPGFSDSATVLVNLSGQSLCDNEFVEYLEQELNSGDFKKDSICFEVAERAVNANLRGISSAIKRLSEQGCRFALDDFGGGLNSMGNLQELGIEYVKLDGNLVKNMTNNQIDAAMVRAINEIAHAMGLSTIAEMVESEEVVEAIRSLGVDYCQGHAIAVPQPVEELFNAARKAEGLCIIS